MSHNDIIQAWKSEPEDRMIAMPENPVGEELTEEELGMISGGGIYDSGSCSCSCGNCGRNHKLSISPEIVVSNHDIDLFAH